MLNTGLEPVIFGFNTCIRPMPYQLGQPSKHFRIATMQLCLNFVIINIYSAFYYRQQIFRYYF
jgi:hypothetical protein